ncbi:IS3 family transposase [Bacillus sp. CECT 9360]|uniref:IS3 family transposase n=1 Tax=Bacillus sp. CECT 9360 TaxID=2845821 RepID=UPI001E46B454|nr:IS3 family transposase [Bacillus sp. CECT 9360]
MSKLIFNDIQMKLLEKNPNVDHVSERSISYTSDFKLKAVKENLNGKSPTQIFIEHDFDLKVIGSTKPKECLRRWRKTFKEFGEEGFTTERRGKASTGRPSSTPLSVEANLKKAEARIKYLEAELGILKKVRRTRKAGGEEEKITTSEKFMLIEQTIRRFALSHMVTYLCKMAGVSRSGYYAWIKDENERVKRDENDWKDYELIKKIFDEKNGKAGALVIKMILEKDYFVVMNHKKIRRLMKKFHLVAKIRQINPYRKMAKATQEHKTHPNLLNREFNQDEPGKVLLTDITYVFYGAGRPAYLSCVKDASTREIVAFNLSRTLKMDIVYDTLDKLSDSLGDLIHPHAIIHSDQGFHYTHPEFQKRVKELKLTQSMSRKGNCWDNAPMESFFGHLKDEVEYSKCQTFEELKSLITEYMEQYNNYRYQWTLNKMTPVQYRSHLLTA